MTPSPIDHARACLEAARAAQGALRDEYEVAPSRRDTGHNARVAGLHQSINYGLKAAEVEALLAIATQLGARTTFRPAGEYLLEEGPPPRVLEPHHPACKRRQDPTAACHCGTPADLTAASR